MNEHSFTRMNVHSLFGPRGKSSALLHCEGGRAKNRAVHDVAGKQMRHLEPQGQATLFDRGITGNWRSPPCGPSTPSLQGTAGSPSTNAPRRVHFLAGHDRKRNPHRGAALPVRQSGCRAQAVRGAHAGAFTVYLAWNSSGTVSDLTRETQPFTIKAEDLARAKASHFTYTFEVKVDKSTKALGVGVLDETSKEYGTLTVNLPRESSANENAARVGRR